MALNSEAGTWAVRVVLIAGAVLALARFVRYVQVVTDNEVAVAASLAWWGVYAAGLGLLALGAIAHLRGRDPELEQAAWVGLLVGLVLLTIMPASPAPGVELRQALGGMFGA